MNAALHVYALITATRVRLFTAHSRALKVYQRAKRMGLAIEFTGDDVRRGDPYRRTKLETHDDWGRAGSMGAP